MRVVQFSPLELWSSLDILSGTIAWRDIWIPACRGSGPLMAHSAHAIGPFGHAMCRRVALVLRHTIVVFGVGPTRLLCVQRSRQGINLAFKFSDAAIGLLLALSGGWGGDADT